MGLPCFVEHYITFFVKRELQAHYGTTRLPLDSRPAGLLSGVSVRA